MVIVAKEMAGEKDVMHSIMRQFLIQQAFCDEWYRVLMCEKRVALGVFVVAGYFLSTFTLFWTIGVVSKLSMVLVLPYLLSVLISGWMNVFMYFDRRKARKEADEPARQANNATRGQGLFGETPVKSIQY